MARTTLESLKVLLEGETVSDALLEKALSSAARHVVSDGVREGHEAFAELQEYYAASILQSGGHISGVLAAKSVSDVSESYSTAVGDSAGGWIGLYRKELLTIIGKKGFIA